MKNIIIILIVFSLFSGKSFAKSDAKIAIGSVLYHDREKNIEIMIGTILRKNSKLVFEANKNIVNNHNIPVQDENINIKEVITNYKQKEKYKLKVIHNLTKLIQIECDEINELRGIYSELHFTFLDMQTKEIFQIKQKSVVITSDHRNFINVLARILYKKLDVLLIPNL